MMMMMHTDSEISHRHGRNCGGKGPVETTLAKRTLNEITTINRFHLMKCCLLVVVV